MKPLLYIVVALFLPHIVFSQTAVEKLARALDALGKASYDHWKVSPDVKSLRSMKGDPSSQKFDDSQWNNLTLDESIYLDVCWIRKEIALPEMVLGKRIQGSVRLQVSVVLLEPPNLVLSTMKKAEDSNSWIVQWYNARDGDTEAVLMLPSFPKRVMMSDALEEDGAPVLFGKNAV